MVRPPLPDGRRGQPPDRGATSRADARGAKMSHPSKTTAKTKSKQAKINAVLSAIARCANVAQACRAVGADVYTYYRWLREDPELRRRHEEAVDVGLDLLENRVQERAYEQSDRLCEFLLKARRPEKWGDKTADAPAPKVDINISLDKPAE